MAINTATAQWVYNGNSSATQFAYTQPIQSSTSLEVFLTDTNNISYPPLVNNVDYTVIGVNDTNSGNWYIVYNPVGGPLPTGWKITLNLDTSLLNPRTFDETLGYDAFNVSKAFDLCSLNDLTLQRQIDFLMDQDWPALTAEVIAAAAIASAAAVASAASASAASTSASNASTSASNASSSASAAAASAASAAAVAVTIAQGTVQGRLTPLSGEPVFWNNGTGVTSTTLYWDYYFGNKVGLYNGSTWVPVPHTAPSISLSTVAAGNYHTFLYQSAGVVAIELGNTGSVNLALQDGVLVKSGDSTRRYVGHINVTTSNLGVDYYTTRSAETGGAKIDVWNLYNQVDITAYTFFTTDSWTYSTNAWRLAGGITNAQIRFALGTPFPVYVDGSASITTNNNSRLYQVAFSTDATNPAFTCQEFGIVEDSNGSSSGWMQSRAVYRAPLSGFNTISLLERAASGAAVAIYGDNGGQFQSALSIRYRG